MNAYERGEIVASYSRVVILGAGPAGLSATRLIKREFPKVEVVVIDQGLHGNPTYSACLAHIPGLKESTGGVGGSTSAGWGGQLLKISQGTLDNWVSDHFGFGFCKRLSIEMARDFDNLIDVFDLPSGEFKTNEEEIFFEDSSGFRITKRFSSYPVEKDLSIVFSDFIFDPSLKLVKRRINSMEIRNDEIGLHYDDGEIEYFTDTLFVVALGCIETTSLILKSFPEDSLKFGIGVGLRDHPSTYLYQFKTKRFSKTRLSLGTAKRTKVKYEVNEDQGQRERPEGFFEIQETYGQIISQGTLAYSGSRFHQAVGKVRSIFRRLLPLSVFDFLFERDFVVWSQIEQSSDPNNALILKDGLLNSTWKLRRRDVTLFQQISNVSRQWLSEYSVVLGPEVNLENLLNLNPKTFQAAHPSGTIRVSEDENKALVDSHGRLHISPHILIASSALFKKDGWQNPTLSIMALASSLTRIAMNREPCHLGSEISKE